MRQEDRGLLLGPAAEPIPPQLQGWARHVIQRVSATTKPVETRRRRKMLVVHLDGVPKALLDEALAQGRMPFLRSLIDSGQYNLSDAFWGTPASTPCFQAGLLYGSRHPNLPAYHWYDRELGRVVRMNVPKDTLAVQSRLHRHEHNSLLEDGGTAYLSLFNGLAEHQIAMASMADLRRVVKSVPQMLQGIRAPARSSVFQYVRQLISQTWTAGLDMFSWARQVRDWRHEGDFLRNGVLISLVWELAHKRALIDMVRGVPAIYLVYGNYDEVAHRRGPRSAQATRQLYRVDARLAELYALGRTLPEPYDLFFVSDHGHVDSVPFERTAGEGIAQALLGPSTSAGANGLSDAVRAALGAPRIMTSAQAGPLHHKPEVVDCGNFAHVYLAGGGMPLAAAEIVANHPDVLARAISHPDIDIVALRRGEEAVAVLDGRVVTADEVANASMPLALPEAFSRRALADYLRELPAMKTAGDIVLFGRAVNERGTVGFAWEFGSHGGLTQAETRSFVLWPNRAPLDLDGLGHAVQLHERLSAVYRN